MIKHISFYKDGKRITVAPGPTGLFTVRVSAQSSSGYPATKDLELTASGLVNHADYKDCDPTLTLEDGKKVRVYHAGNSHIPIVHPSLVIDAFDEGWRKKRSKGTSGSVKDRLKNKKREERTTQPMAPIIPPAPPRVSANKSVKVSNSPPLRSANPNSDPFASIMNEWYGVDDDDPNDGLYENCDSGYYPTEEEYED